MAVFTWRPIAGAISMASMVPMAGMSDTLSKHGALKSMSTIKKKGKHRPHLF
ncbi:hypothetical protein SESBI_33212 [Sesbania bispinosa]|nr:hypothetical protein SESBI_33212 [Sesbania bispinosa]